MFGWSGRSFARPANVVEIERRLRSLEQQLKRSGGRASVTTGRAPDDVKRTDVQETIVSMLSSIADQFIRNASDIGDGTTKFGSEAAKLGNDALRRLAKQVERRPFVTLAVAIGVGAVVGLVSYRR